jgi:hypothetical protein
MSRADYGLKHGILVELSAILSSFKFSATSGKSIAETEPGVPQGAEQKIKGTVRSDLYYSDRYY